MSHSPLVGQFMVAARTDLAEDGSRSPYAIVTRAFIGVCSTEMADPIVLESVADARLFVKNHLSPARYPIILKVVA